MAAACSRYDAQFVRELVRILRSSQAAIVEAAGKTRDRETAQVFYQVGNTHAKFEQELERYVCIDQDATQCSSTVIGKLQHLWRRLRTSLRADEPYAVLTDMVQSEDAILEQYRRTIVPTAAAPLQRALCRQTEELVQLRETLRRLRDSKPTDRA